MKQVNAKTMKRILKSAGYEHIRTKGSHEIWNKNGSVIVVPALELNPMIARRLIRENNLSKYLTGI